MVAIGLAPGRTNSLSPPVPVNRDWLRARRDWSDRPEIMLYEVGDVRAVHYAEAACALGAARIEAALPNLTDGVTVAARWERARAIPNSANHVDANLIGIWPMLLGDPDGSGIALADGQWESVTADGLTAQARFWIDDVWMIGALQVQAYILTKETRFTDRAALMARIYLERLQRPDGLFNHGPEAPFAWGRGNGWVAAGLAEVLSSLPAGHPDRPAILDGYRRMMAALLEHQAESGMWRQVIDHPESWVESSGTAMFAFAMLRGANRGLLEGADYRLAAHRAWDAIADHVGTDGRLKEVCVGTGQSQDLQYYLDRPKVTGDLHGQAALMWFAAEMLV